MQPFFAFVFIISQVIFTASTTTYSYDGDLCTTDEDCQAIGGNLNCIDGICTCPSGYIANDYYWCVPTTETNSLPSTTTTLIYDSILGGSCDTNSNCGGLVGNSECVNRICVCRQGYIADGRFRCIPIQDSSPAYPDTDPSTSTLSDVTVGDAAIGGACSSSDHCHALGGNSTCISGKCGCLLGYVPYNSIYCVPETDLYTTVSDVSFTDTDYRGLGDPCDENHGCVVAGAANWRCLNGICACAEGYVAYGRYFCFRSTISSTASTNTISSTSDFTKTNDLSTSTPVIFGDSALGGVCIDDDDCGLITNGICDSGICACKLGYIENNPVLCVLETDMAFSTFSRSSRARNSVRDATVSTTRLRHTIHQWCRAMKSPRPKFCSIYEIFNISH